MPDYLCRAQVTIPRDTGIAEDNVVNTFYFDCNDTGIGTAHSINNTTILSMLTTFYNAIDQYLSPVVGPSATVKLYDMRDATPRVPTGTGTIALTPGAGSGLPEEVALCLSFSGDIQSGDNPRRLRGRVYLGPLDSGNGIITNGAYRPASSMLTAIANAASAMAATHQNSQNEDVNWAIYSRALDNEGSLDDAFNDVTNGWVDNSYDTQRRRGPKPSAKTLWT